MALGVALFGCDDISSRGPRSDPVAFPAAESGPPAVFPPGEWVSLFDGKSLRGWKVLNESFFDEHGKVDVEAGKIILGPGNPAAGIRWDGNLPRDNYEVSLDAMRVEGSDFFCGMTFPVGDSPCTLILGGWGGSVVGLSNVDQESAVENETSTAVDFEDNRWYRVRLRVTAEKIEAWIDDDRVIQLARSGREFSIWFEQEPVKPFGIATWYTGAALRDIKFRTLEPDNGQ